MMTTKNDTLLERLKDWDGIGETPSMIIEELAEIFYRIHWRGRMEEYRRTVLDRHGDWSKVRIEVRERWRAEARRFLAGQPLAVFEDEDEPS
jgi:hypothetical protein